MKQTDPQIKLRLPPKLYRDITEAAAELRRPISAEIVARLEASFQTVESRERSEKAVDRLMEISAERAHGSRLEEKVAALEARIDALEASQKK